MDFYGIEKLSLVDYDNKLTTTLFTSPCNFRCLFCHNSRLALKEEIEKISFEEILSYLNSRKTLIEAVCISGGEPTLSHNIEETLTEIKKMGFLVKLDTNGSNPEMIKKLYEKKLIDYVAMDIKSSFDNYLDVINLKSFDLRKINDSIDFLINSPYDYEFRITLISEYHTEENIRKIGQMVKGAHKIYLQKFKSSDECMYNRFGIKCLTYISKEKALKYKVILEEYVDKVLLRGY